MNRFMKAAVATVIVVALAACLGGCGKKGNVAATVNGEDIYEDDVTTYVEQMRTYYGCTDDADWATFLSSYGYQPSDIRDLAIDSLAQEKLVTQKADELGVTVSDDDVNSQISTMRETYGYTDDSDWEKALTSAGYASQDDYFKAMKSSLLQQAVLEKEVPTSTPTDDEIVAAAPSYTGKRASGIMVATQDAANAILAQLQTSTDVKGDFAKAYAASNTDTQYTGTDGDLGWTTQNYMVYYYSLTNTGTALTTMNKGDLKVIQETDGYWVIYCTDDFEIADGATITKNDIPSDLISVITDAVQSSTWQSACDDYLKSLVDDADIQKNDMPSGLSYDVDMSLATTTNNTSAGTSTGTTSSSTTTDGSSTTSSTGSSTSSTTGSSTGSSTGSTTGSSTGTTTTTTSAS